MLYIQLTIYNILYTNMYRYTKIPISILILLDYNGKYYYI